MSTVLVVDDDPRMRDLLYRLFRDAGYSVTAVETGRAALQVGAAGSYAAALVELELPGKDGIETIQALKALSPKLSILAMSAGDPDALEAARKQGADQIIAKPFRAEQVLDKVVGALGQ